MPKRNFLLSIETVQKAMDLFGNYSQAAKHLNNCHRDTLRRFVIKNNIKFIRKENHKHSEETKRKLSIIKKEFLSKNPDKHHWRKSDKFKSVPCERLKEWLKSKNIEFIEEFQPQVLDRNFSIDIAFPDKMIGIEVNGNQHYNSDGTLKPYYQNRHSIIESAGWKIYQLHYSICFKINEIENLIPSILNSSVKVNFDYKVYFKPIKEKKKFFCSCGNEKDRQASLCMECFAFKNRKCERPIKEELEKLIFEMPLIKIGKVFGVSNGAIKKWCLKYKLDLPPQCYWPKRHAGYSHEDALLKNIPKIKQPIKRFSDKDVIEIRKLLKDGELFQWEIAKKFNCDRRTIEHIKYNRTYKDIT